MPARNVPPHAHSAPSHVVMSPAPALGCARRLWHQGYGEVSEHTIDAAVDVLGRAPMPERPIEDRLFEASEQVRAAAWDGAATVRARRAGTLCRRRA